MFDSAFVRINSENLRAFAQQVNQISTVSAACVDNAHAGRDVAAQDLIENVNVDLAEEFLDVRCHAPIGSVS
jgi:hypothetical protein